MSECPQDYPAAPPHPRVGNKERFQAPYPLLAWLPPGGLFSKTEMSEVLTEILRVDPAFDKERFLQQCENDIIPNVLEVGAQPRRPLLGPHQIRNSSRRVFSEQRQGLSSEARGPPHVWPSKKATVARAPLVLVTVALTFSRLTGTLAPKTESSHLLFSSCSLSEVIPSWLPGSGVCPQVPESFQESSERSWLLLLG